MKRTITGILVTAAALVLLALPAGAHNHTVSGSCAAGISVSLTSYNGSAQHANSVVVKFDGAVVASNANFGSSFSFSKANPDKTVGHTYQVDVSAWDSSAYDVHTGVVAIPSCEVPPPTTTVPVPPTTTVPDPTPPTVPTPPAALPPTAVVAPPAFTG